MSNKSDAAAAALYDEAVRVGDLSFYGLSVLALLIGAPSSWELNTTRRAVVSPTKLARVAKAPRAAIVRGLRELLAARYVDAITVWGAKKRNKTFAVRLLTPAEVLVVVASQKGGE